MEAARRKEWAERMVKAVDSDDEGQTAAEFERMLERFENEVARVARSEELNRILRLLGA